MLNTQRCYLYGMFMVKSKSILYHVAFWAALYLLWIVIFRSYSVPVSKTLTIEFCYLLFITADYYAISNFIVPRFLMRKQYFLFAATVLLTILLSGWLRAVVAMQMNLHIFHNNTTTDFLTLFVSSVFNIALWVLLITLIKMVLDRRQTQQQLEAMEKERIKNELDFLKAQINPHALFNSLNTIYGYIDKSNQAARNVLLQFAELLRYQLYDCNAEKVSLEKELEYIKNYIAFQQLRKDDDLVVCTNICNVKPGLTIAPLLLVVLAENAFKFVSSFTGKENKISITITADDDQLKTSFINTKEMQQNNAARGSGGIGISNLKRRLALLYPGKHQLIVNDNTTTYETHLNINLA